MKLDFPQSFQKVIVSCSGGLDSTALFHLLVAATKSRQPFELAVFHVNYGLRGHESKADFRFCAALAESAKTPFFSHEISPDDRPSGASVQEWARQVRRSLWHSYAADGWVVALGHHLDDLAETVLMRLARGAGPNNLLGMRPWAAPLWRPLLYRRKRELRAFLETRNLPWREDSSNQSDAYARNSVRHNVLGTLEALWPGASDRIVATALDIDSVAAETRRCVDEHRRESSLAGTISGLPDALARQLVAERIQTKTGSLVALSRPALDSIIEAGRRHFRAKAHHTWPTVVASLMLPKGRRIVWANGELQVQAVQDRHGSKVSMS